MAQRYYQFIYHKQILLSKWFGNNIDQRFGNNIDPVYTLTVLEKSYLYPTLGRSFNDS